MTDDECVEFDGLDLAGRVASGEVSADELQQLARARAGNLNPRINAICLRLDEHADRQATGPLSGPFAGVPFLLKDLNQDIEGVPTSAGCRALAGRPARQTSTMVEGWRDAGLVIFGKTTTPEFGSKGVTEADLFDPTRNPWDLDRTPGGSSGGAAASDGGGSIRIRLPATFSPSGSSTRASTSTAASARPERATTDSNRTPAFWPRSAAPFVPWICRPPSNAGANTSRVWRPFSGPTTC